MVTSNVESQLAGISITTPTDRAGDQRRNKARGRSQPRRWDGKGRSDGKTPTRGKGRAPDRASASAVPDERVLDQVASGDLVIGTYHRPNPRAVFVNAPGWDLNIAIDPKKSLNAFDGDTVAVRLLPSSQWTRMRDMAFQGEWTEKAQSSRYYSYYGETEPVGDAPTRRVQVELSKPVIQPEGFIVNIIKSVKPDFIVGKLRPRNKDDTLDSDQVQLVPLNRTLPMFNLRPSSVTAARRSAALTDNALYLARYVSWTGYHALADIVRCLGDESDSQAQSAAILQARQFDDCPWSSDILNEVPGDDYTIPDDVMAARRDLRDLPILTIDPITAKDLDDALHVTLVEDAEDAEDRVYEVGVHIADVSHFVQSGSAMDERAQRNCTTVYLVNKAVPMLPERLSEQVCSLNPCEDKLAFSVIWRQHGDGTMARGDVWFGRTVIHPKARLSYEAAQLILDGAIQPTAASTDIDGWPVIQGFGPAVADSVRALYAINEAVRRDRAAHGYLRCDSNKLCFKLDDTRTTPLAAFIAPHMESHDLVEGFMVTANQLVARRIVRSFPSSVLLRAHIGIKDKLLLEKKMRSAGLRLDTTSMKTISDGLVRIRSRDKQLGDAVAYMLVRFHLIRAEYVTPTEGEEEALVHHGLNVPMYTHFTSPIRRYADIIIHRMLQASLDYEEEHGAARNVLRFDHRTRLFSERPPADHRPSTDALLLARQMADTRGPDMPSSYGRPPKAMQVRRGRVVDGDDGPVFSIMIDDMQDRGEGPVVVTDERVEYLKEKGLDTKEINGLLERINDRTKAQKDAGQDSEQVFLIQYLLQQLGGRTEVDMFIMRATDKYIIAYSPEYDLDVKISISDMPATNITVTGEDPFAQLRLEDVVTGPDTVGCAMAGMLDAVRVELWAKHTNSGWELDSVMVGLAERTAVDAFDCHAGQPSGKAWIRNMKQRETLATAIKKHVAAKKEE